jgi:hypothetical protein
VTPGADPRVEQVNAPQGGRSIVGDWAETRDGCASPMAGLVRIGPKSLTTDEMSCTFRYVSRAGSIVTWTGSCNEGGWARPMTVTAAESGGRLTIRFASGNAWAPLMRCPRRTCSRHPTQANFGRRIVMDLQDIYGIGYASASGVVEDIQNHSQTQVWGGGGGGHVSNGHSYLNDVVIQSSTESWKQVRTAWANGRRGSINVPSDVSVVVGDEVAVVRAQVSPKRAHQPGEQPVLALDVVDDRAVRPGEQCRHDEASPCRSASARSRGHAPARHGVGSAARPAEHHAIGHQQPSTDHLVLLGHRDQPSVVTSRASPARQTGMPMAAKPAMSASS